MIAYIIRRILLMFPTLIGMSMLVFFIMQAAPGDVADMLIDSDGSMKPSERAAFRRYLNKRYGLEAPMLVQYGRWLNRISPLGFKTNQDTDFTEEEITEVRLQLDDAGVFKTERARYYAELASLSLARYLDTSPTEGTAQFIDAFRGAPLEAVSLLDAVGVKQVDIDQPLDEDMGDLAIGRWEELTKAREQLATDPDRAQETVVVQMYNDIDGELRIFFTKPTLKSPDFGQSIRKNQPIKNLIADSLPITITLNLISIPIIYTLSIISGIYAARHQGGLYDVGSGSVLLALWSIPSIWAGVLLIGFLANKQYFYWFPTGGLHDLNADTMPFLPRFGESGFERGWLLDTLWHFVLPVACMTYAGFAFLSKLSRSAVLENLRSDFVRTARAKGVADRDVLWVHTFRNSLLPLITVVVSIIPGMLAGSVIVETIFSIDGMGKLFVEAVKFQDQEMVMAITVLGGVLAMIAYLLADILYAVADPRVSYE